MGAAGPVLLRGMSIAWICVRSLAPSVVFGVEVGLLVASDQIDCIMFETYDALYGGIVDDEPVDTEVRVAAELVG